MGGKVSGIKLVTDILQPRTLKRLVGAGALDARSPVALGAALPWLIGRGPSLGIVCQMNAIAIGSKVAIHDRNGSITWRQLDYRVNRAAHLLRKAGVEPGDKIALLLRNGREMAEVALAAQKIGVIACPLNTWAKTKELQAVMANVSPALIVYDTAHADQVRNSAPSTATWVFVGDEHAALPRSLPYEELLADNPPTPPAPITGDRGSAKIIIQTSGTTGTPKGASRDASAAGMGALANLLGSVPYRRDDVILCPAPMFHSFGLATFTFASALGATLILPDRFDPEQSLALIDEHRATAASFVPVMLRRIVSLPDDVKSRYAVDSLRIVMTSGSALSRDLKLAATELFGEVLYDLYGSTEAGWVAIASPDVIREHPSSVGRPVEGIEVAVFSRDGERLPPNEVGDLYIRSNVMFEGYTSGESKDERDGFMAIGDLGRFDDDGLLYVEARTDDMVVVGGENVYPIEVEDVIESLPGVTEVSVLGVEDDEYGHVLGAVVVGSVDEDAVRAACEAELASYKVPKRVKVVAELPRTSTGKVLKRELAGLLESRS